MYKTRSKNIQRGVNKKGGVSRPSLEVLKARERSDKKYSAIGTTHTGKLVEGIVTDIVQYGAIVDVDGVRCFVHISQLADRHISSPHDVLSIGESYQFKVLEKALDKKQKMTFILTMKLNEVETLSKKNEGKFSNTPFTSLDKLKSESK